MLEKLRHIGDWNTGQKSALEVIGGVHTGVSITLDPADYTIGSTPDANIVLKDTGVRPLHAALRVGLGGVRIQAIGGDVRLDDGQVLPKGYGAKLRLPVQLSFGEARLRLSRVADDANRGDAVLQPLAGIAAEHPIMATAGTLCCVLMMSFAAGGLPISSPVPSKVAESGLETEPHPLPAKPKTAAQQNGADINAAVERFSEHLKAAGLGSLKVKASDKRVAVSGSLLTREAESWAAAQRWFDDTFAGRVVLTATVAIGAARAVPTALRLQAIWFGERPYVITEDGLRYFPGAFLDNGWIIQEIEENGVILAKDGETMTLTFR